MNSVVEDVISKLIDCDDFHKRCDCLLEHSEITYLLDYIYYLQEKNADLKELCNKYEEEHSTVFKEWQDNNKVLEEFKKVVDDNG